LLEKMECALSTNKKKASNGVNLFT
jgi:hypothetical protein